MTVQEIFDKLKERYNDEVQSLVTDKPVDPFITVSPDKMDEIGL